MTASAIIKKVLASGVLEDELCEVPTRGATAEEIAAEEQLVGRKFCPDHVALLKSWNGIGLEVIRFFGCGKDAAERGRLGDFTLEQDDPDQMIIIGSDPAGVVYLQAKDGGIWMFDAEGAVGENEDSEASDLEDLEDDDSDLEGETELVAHSLDEFLENLVFGPEADQFIDEDWKADLQAAGVFKN